MQNTIKSEILIEGIGIHTGKKSTVRLKPAEENRGRVFHTGESWCAAVLKYVDSTDLCTALRKGNWQVMTVEHLLGALYAMEIDNVEIHLDGPELPILDGSAATWLKAIQRVGIRHQKSKANTFKPKRKQIHRKGDRWISMEPAEDLELSIVHSHPHPMIGEQILNLKIVPEVFSREIAPARTFGFIKDHEEMKKKSRGLGAGPENCLIFTEKGFFEGQSQRLPLEPARHKLLDLLGDISLTGRRLKAHFRSNKPGHAITIEALKSWGFHSS